VSPQRDMSMPPVRTHDQATPARCGACGMERVALADDGVDRLRGGIVRRRRRASVHASGLELNAGWVLRGISSEIVIADDPHVARPAEDEPREHTEKGILPAGLRGDNMGISQRLKAARARTSLRQVDLARETGVGLRTIREIEQTNLEPRLATARKLATALGVRVEWLVFGIEPMTETAAIEEEKSC
jgi:DNA-binding XRE family transcriptional regulator